MDEPPPETLQQFARLCDVLGDPVRLRVLLLLAWHGEATVTTLTAELGLPQPTVSHHLGVLRRRGLVAFHKRPWRRRYHHYSLTDRVTASGGTLQVDGFGLRLTFQRSPASVAVPPGHVGDVPDDRGHRGEHEHRPSANG